MSTFYRDGNALQEKARMEKPERVADPYYKIGDYIQELEEQFKESEIQYQQHIDSLRRIPIAPGTEDQWPEGDLVEGKDFEVKEKIVSHPPSRKPLGKTGTIDLSHGWWAEDFAYPLHAAKERNAMENNQLFTAEQMIAVWDAAIDLIFSKPDNPKPSKQKYFASLGITLPTDKK